MMNMIFEIHGQQIVDKTRDDLIRFDDPTSTILIMGPLLRNKLYFFQFQH